MESAEECLSKRSLDCIIIKKLRDEILINFFGVHNVIKRHQISLLLVDNGLNIESSFQLSESYKQITDWEFEDQDSKLNDSWSRFTYHHPCREDREPWIDLYSFSDASVLLIT